MKAVLAFLVLLIVGAFAEEANFKDWKEKQEKGGEVTTEEPKDDADENSGERVRSPIVKPKKVKSAPFPQKVRGNATPKPPPPTLSYVSLMGPIKDQGKSCCR